MVGSLPEPEFSVANHSTRSIIFLLASTGQIITGLASILLWCSEYGLHSRCSHLGTVGLAHCGCCQVHDKSI